MSRVKEELEELRMFVDIGEGTITESQTEDKDWINNWKQYFHQFYVDDILIIPSWEEVKPEDKGKMIIHIDPGTAFGTGMHETTQLCMRQLKKYVTPDTGAFGCGHGQRNTLHRGSEDGGKACCGDGSGPLRHLCNQGEYGGKWYSGQ